jgi:hypothetical protein
MACQENASQAMAGLLNPRSVQKLDPLKAEWVRPARFWTEQGLNSVIRHYSVWRLISSDERLMFGLLAVTVPLVARVQPLPVQNLHLSLDEPVCTGLPFWIKADLGYPYEARYPYREDPRDFGPNEIELKRGSETILPLSFYRLGIFLAAEYWMARQLLPMHRQIACHYT